MLSSEGGAVVPRGGGGVWDGLREVGGDEVAGPLTRHGGLGGLRGSCFVCIRFERRGADGFLCDLGGPVIPFDDGRRVDVVVE